MSGVKNFVSLMMKDALVPAVPEDLKNRLTAFRLQYGTAPRKDQIKVGWFECFFPVFNDRVLGFL
jgi:hypothetical protein